MTIATRYPKSWAVPKFDIKDSSLRLYLPLWYPYSDMTGSTIYSYDTNRLSGTVTDATWGSEGRTFNGTNQDIRIASPPFTTDDSGTVILWMKDTVLASGYPGIYSDADTNNANDEFRIIPNANGSFDIDCLDGGVNDVVRTPTGLLSTTRFSFVVVTSDGSTWSVYHGTPTTAPTLQTLSLITGGNNGDWFGDLSTAETFVLGGIRRLAGLVSDWTGTIGDVWVYNRVPTLAELTNLWSVTKWRY